MIPTPKVSEWVEKVLRDVAEDATEFRSVTLIRVNPSFYSDVLNHPVAVWGIPVVPHPDVPFGATVYTSEPYVLRDNGGTSDEDDGA